MSENSVDLRLSGFQVLMYSLPAIPTAALGFPLILYLPPLFAEETGHIAAVGVVFMIAKLWDVITDPIVGGFVDRISTRYGRRRLSIVVSVPLIVLSVWFLFIEEPDGSLMRLLVWLLVMYVGWTVLTLSHTAWGAELGVNERDRSRLQGWREFGITIGILIAVAVPLVFFGDADDELHGVVSQIGWFVILSLPVAIAFTVLAVPESSPRVTKTNLGVLDGLKTAWQIRPFRYILAADLLGGLAAGTMSSLFVFFTKYVLLYHGDLSIILVVYFAGAGVGVPIWMYISYHIGKHRTLVVAVGLSCILIPIGLLLKNTPQQLQLLWCFFLGTGYGAAPFLIRSLTADIIHSDVAMQHAGMLFALITTTTKLGLGMATGITYICLGLLGFNPATTNSAQAVNVVAALFVIGGPAGLLAMAGMIIQSLRSSELSLQKNQSVW